MNTAALIAIKAAVEDRRLFQLFSRKNFSALILSSVANTLLQIELRGAAGGALGIFAVFQRRDIHVFFENRGKVCSAFKAARRGDGFHGHIAFFE